MERVKAIRSALCCTAVLLGCSARTAPKIAPQGPEVLGCRVLVLPTIDPPEGFPDAGRITEETNYFCEPPRDERRTRWGFSKNVPY